MEAILNLWPYLKNFDCEQGLQSDRMGKIMKYSPEEIIYSKDGGILDCVHFVVSGECTILQCLKVKVDFSNGRKVYTLCENEEEMKKQRDLATAQSVVGIFRQKNRNNFDNRNGKLQNNSDELEFHITLSEQFEIAEKTSLIVDSGHNQKATQKKPKPGNNMLKSTPRPPSMLDSASPLSSLKLSMYETAKIMAKMKRVPPEVPPLCKQKEKHENSLATFTPVRTMGKSHDVNIDNITLINSRHNQQHQSNGKSSQVDDSSCSLPFKNKLLNYDENINKKTQCPGYEKQKQHFECHFVEIGKLTKGAIFGLGEDMIERAIVAKTAVQCLLLPRYWLLERKQNPGGLWNRLRFHINNTIPSRKEVFIKFLTIRNWNKYKQEIIENIVKQSKAYNWTKIEDVPIICRLSENTSTE